MAISGVGSTDSSSSSSANSAVLNALASSQFVSESTFLQLLITQLKNQDPLNPQSGSQFVAELAQFSSVEQLTQLSTNINTVLDNSATNLIGQTVTVEDPTQQSGFLTGTVSGIVYYENGPAVQVDGNNYPLSAIQNVGSVVSTSSES